MWLCFLCKCLEKRPQFSHSNEKWSHRAHDSNARSRAGRSSVKHHPSLIEVLLILRSPKYRGQRRCLRGFTAAYTLLNQWTGKKFGINYAKVKRKGVHFRSTSHPTVVIATHEPPTARLRLANALTSRTRNTHKLIRLAEQHPFNDRYSNTQRLCW